MSNIYLKVTIEENSAYQKSGTQDPKVGPGTQDP